jgi:hypothetical protein
MWIITDGMKIMDAHNTTASGEFWGILPRFSFHPLAVFLLDGAITNE